MENLLILGAGGYGQTVRETALLCGTYGEIAFLDDADPAALDVCGAYAGEAMRARFGAAYPAFGANRLRVEWLARLREAGYAIPTLIHPMAFVSPSAQLGRGVTVLAQAAVGARCALGDGCLVNMGALLDHDCVLANGVHLAPGAVVKAGNRIDAYEKIESGTVLERKIGR